MSNEEKTEESLETLFSSENSKKNKISDFVSEVQAKVDSKFGRSAVSISGAKNVPVEVDQETCDCSQAVLLSGLAGKDYLVMHVGDKIYRIHLGGNCYQEVIEKIQAEQET